MSDQGGSCLLLNFFLLFGVSFVLGVVFLHYSVSMVRYIALNGLSVLNSVADRWEIQE